MRVASLLTNGELRLVDAGKQADDARDIQLDWLPVNRLCRPSSEGWGVPATDATRIFCIGLNYMDHVAELETDIPGEPTIFTRFPQSFTGHEQPMLLPAGSQQFDFEGELVIVIGRAGRHVSKAAALDHVFGYSVANDGTARDFQFRSTQWTAGKNFDASGSIGPAIIPAGELPEGARGLQIETRLNGRTVQQSNTDALIFDVATIIHDISQFTALRAGDLILTGTPAGVGVSRSPQLFLQPGDLCEVEIEGIGCLSNPITSTNTPLN